jgi:hypothetical protein
MRNPLRTEAEAFRFLIVVIAGAIVIAALASANKWAGVAAAVLVVGGIGWWLWRSPPAAGDGPIERLGSSTPLGRHRVLLVAPPYAEPDPLVRQLRARVDGGPTEVLVVVPALSAPLEAVTGDVDDRRAEAQHAARELAARLGSAGIDARGTVGADETLLAVEDALREFGADEVVLVGDEPLLEQARERIAVPVSLLG